MQRSFIALIAAGLCLGCHPKPKKKPPGPKAALEHAISNECDEAVNVVFGAHPDSDDAIVVELEVGETIVWALRATELVWGRDGDDADWVSADFEGDHDTSVVSACIVARQPHA